LAQWAVGDLSGGETPKYTNIQPHTTLHRGFLAIHFVKVKWNPDISKNVANSAKSADATVADSTDRIEVKAYYR
jgi:hypothetical protein